MITISCHHDSWIFLLFLCCWSLLIVVRTEVYQIGTIKKKRIQPIRNRIMYMNQSFCCGNYYFENWMISFKNCKYVSNDFVWESFEVCIALGMLFFSVKTSSTFWLEVYLNIIPFRHHLTGVFAANECIGCIENKNMNGK